MTLFGGLVSWLVTGHAEARQLLADPRLSADRRRDGFPVVMRRMSAPAQRPAFVFLDPPEHGRYRRMLTSEFSLRRFKELRPQIERTVHERLDAMLAAGPPAELTEGELVENALILLVAGHETTAATIALGVIALLDHPEQLAKLHETPETAIEEILRYTSVVDTSPARIAVTDIEIGDTVIKAGEGVLISSSMANRDPAAFTGPDRFDVTRQARQHIAFGYGVHQCLDQNLARMELELALSTLFQRIPALRLDTTVDDLPLRPATSIQGVNALPVNW